VEIRRRESGRLTRRRANLFAMARLLERANLTKVDPHLMEDVLEAVADLPAEDRGLESTMFLIVKRVAELGLPQPERKDLSMAINFRFMAFARLMERGAGKGWPQPGADGCTYVHSELIRAAAEEPMIEVDDDVALDSDSFHRRLLALAEMHGEA